MGFSYQYPEMQVLKIIYFHFSNIRSQPASQLAVIKKSNTCPKPGVHVFDSIAMKY